MGESSHPFFYQAEDIFRLQKNPSADLGILPTFFLIAASGYTYYTKVHAPDIIKGRKSALNNSERI